MLPRTAYKKGNIPWNKGKWYQSRCLKCDIEFTNGIKNYHKKFCSPQCSNSYNAKPGKDNPHWNGGKQTTGNGYVSMWMPSHPNADKRGRILEHRYIMEQYLGRYLKRNEFIDHINGIRDDNRIENLRLATQAQNSANRGKQKNNTTGYKNIHLDKNSGKYYIQIGFKGKTYCFGHYINIEEAIEVRDKALKKLHGEFAKLD